MGESKTFSSNSGFPAMLYDVSYSSGKKTVLFSLSDQQVSAGKLYFCENNLKLIHGQENGRKLQRLSEKLMI
ncbi:MAG: hypothetical protein J7M18_00800 [Candidatus Eremiobacteraeota bacterium]|nr:hypothetical protein [Candidatus Eremiobacteraeota bacterium]